MYAEPIKIQLGKIYMNRTRKYLFPIIKEYDSDMVFRINSLLKVAVGIGDFLVERCGFKYEKHLFILVDSRVHPNKFADTLRFLNGHTGFEDDYVYGNIVSSRFHMIVIKIPEKFVPTLELFKESRYSQMYTKEEIRKLFDYSRRTGNDKELYEEISKVLVHDHNYHIHFTRNIRKEFGLSDTIDVATDISSEYDFPISKIQEIFNYKLVIKDENDNV